MSPRVLELPDRSSRRIRKPAQQSASEGALPERATVRLVRGAKAGDPKALADLVDRYYYVWIARYHGKLGAVVRKVYDTQALVQSAVGDAIQGLGDLQNDGVFYAWVTSIIRHKLAKRRARLARETPLGDGSASSILQPVDQRMPLPDETVAKLDLYLHTLDAIAKLLPEYPEEMIAVHLRFLDGLSVSEVVRRLGRPKRTVYRWLHDGMKRLRQCLNPSSESQSVPPSDPLPEPPDGSQRRARANNGSPEAPSETSSPSSGGTGIS